MRPGYLATVMFVLFTGFSTIFGLILLYLHLKCAKKSQLQEVNLEDSVSFLSWWKIVHFDPQERLEYEGQPVPVSLPVTSSAWLNITPVTPSALHVLVNV